MASRMICSGLVTPMVSAMYRRSSSTDPTWRFPPAADETTARAELVEIASGNRVTRALIGRGYYGTLPPPVIRRNILERVCQGEPSKIGDELLVDRQHLESALGDFGLVRGRSQGKVQPLLGAYSPL
jgi:hypothetical protein